MNLQSKWIGAAIIAAHPLIWVAIYLAVTR
jgi:hypothetical protein